MDFKSTVLERITKWIVGGDLFTFIQKEVNIVANRKLSSEEKRTQVIENAKDFASSSAMFMINLALEVSVTILKRKAARYGQMQ